MLLWTVPPECNHTPMVCEKEVGTYYKVLYLLTYTVPYIGIKLNIHKAIGRTLASYSIDANIPLSKPLFWHIHIYFWHVHVYFLL